MNITLKEASEEFLNKLKAEEKSERTVYTYGKDLEQIMAFFMLMLWAKEQEYIQNLPLSKAFLCKTKEEA